MHRLSCERLLTSSALANAIKYRPFQLAISECPHLQAHAHTLYIENLRCLPAQSEILAVRSKISGPPDTTAQYCKKCGPQPRKVCTARQHFKYRLYLGNQCTMVGNAPAQKSYWTPIPRVAYLNGSKAIQLNLSRPRWQQLTLNHWILVGNTL